MAVRLTRGGASYVIERRPRMSHAEMMRRADRRIYTMWLEGYRNSEIARAEDISASWVRRRLKAIPDIAKTEYELEHENAMKHRAKRRAALTERRLASYG